MHNQLLVIIDPQKDFISKEGVYAKKHSGIEQILNARRNINKLLGSHNNGKLAIVFSDYEADQFEKGLSICIPGTIGHQIDIEAGDSITLISKPNHSCFSSEAFNIYLKNNSIERIIVCGFLAEYCVKQTALDGLRKGYHITLLKDCIGTGDDVQYKKEQMLIELAEKGAEILINIF